MSEFMNQLEKIGYENMVNDYMCFPRYYGNVPEHQTDGVVPLLEELHTRHIATAADFTTVTICEEARKKIADIANNDTPEATREHPAKTESRAKDIAQTVFGFAVFLALWVLFMFN